MNQVYQSAFLKALGWSLIDSLWQFGVLWLLYVLLTANGKRYQSHQRHTIALLSLAGGSLWFLVSLVINFYKAAAAPAVITWQGADAPVMDYGILGNTSRLIEPALPLLSIGYLLAAAWLFIRFYYRFHHTKQLLKADMVKASPELRVFLQTAAARMGIKKNVAIWLSAAAEAPMTLGFWKPVILLPISIVNHLSLQQTEAIILHELKHIKRNDYFINILMACADVVLFFNPFARWIAQDIRRERENSCDDLVLQFRYDPALYASSLLILEQQRSARPNHFAVAATGNKTPALLHRVTRILHQKQVSTPVSHRMIAYFLTAVLFGFIALSNPGNVIVKKIYPVVFSGEANAQFASYIPENEEPAPIEKPVVTIKKKLTGTPQPVADSPSITGISMLNPAEAEQVMQVANGIQLASMAQDQQALQFQVQGTLVINVGVQVENRDFTMTSQRPMFYAIAENSAEIKPYVPRSNFAYQYMEDSASPKIYVAPQLQQEAKLAIQRALAELDQVDWAKLEKELVNKGINLGSAQIRQELHRAFMEITWKRICEGSVTPADNVREIYAKAMADWQRKLERFQHDRARKQAEKVRLQTQIVEERILENIKEEQKNAVRKAVIDI
ncbi:MAG: M56 family metallopeptidase [Pseudobacter sp.]|uniref:M56 family metallopeptidase n=1 Tax=Pseudobacter sp. TaxID=2045420 RepID=UPI003F80BECB